MKPLIEIETVPISIQLKVTNAQYVPVETTAELEMTTEEGGGLEIKSKPVRLNIDTYEARKSASNSSAIDSIKEYAQKGKSGAYSATARYSQEGGILMHVKIQDDAYKQITELRLKNNEHKTPNIKWIPDRPVDIEYEPADLTIKYDMDKLKMDVNKQTRPMKFVPGAIEFEITQKPDLIINYVGEPLYVPPSANPNYEPPAGSEK